MLCVAGGKPVGDLLEQVVDSGAARQQRALCRRGPHLHSRNSSASSRRALNVRPFTVDTDTSNIPAICS